VPKFQHLLADTDDLSRTELAVLCVLALRGPQTQAEVITRASRLVPDDPIDTIQSTLEALIAREPTPAVTRLPRRPGQKEARYTHLLLEDEEPSPAPGTAPAPAPAPSPVAGGNDLAADVARLREELDSLRREVADLRAQLGE